MKKGHFVHEGHHYYLVKLSAPNCFVDFLDYRPWK